MALKIEFAAEFKDAERIQKILNDLNDQMSKLAQTGAAVGQASASGFQSLTSSLKGFDDATKGLRSIKELSDSIHSLSKLQGEVGVIDKMFSDIGKSINRGIGDEKADSIKRVREEISKLQQESEKAKVLVQEAEYNYRVAQSRGDERGMKHFEAQRRGASLYAAKMDRDSRLAEDELDEATDPMNVFKGQFQKGGKYYRGMRGIRAAGGYAAAALAGVQAADDLFNVMPERSFAAQQKYDTAAAREAMSGDVTRGVLRELNVGAGASSRFLAGNDQLGQMGTVASTALQTVLGNTIGNIFNLISGRQVEFKSPTQIYNENLMGKEAVDREAYGVALGATGQQAMKRMNMFADMERFGGSAQMQSALAGLTRSGVTMDMAHPMAQMLMEAGVMIGPGDANLVLAQQRLGAGDTFMRQVARQRFMGGGASATGMLDRLVEGSGLTGRDQGRARGVLGEALGGLMSQTVGYDLSNTGAGMINMVGEAVARQQGAANGLTAEEATRGAVSTYSATQNLFQAGGVYNAVEMASLARMGVTNPLVQQYVQTMLEKGNSNEAAAAIERATGGKVKADQALKQLRADTAGMASTFMKPLFDESDPQVRAIGSGKLQAMAMMGKEAVMNKSIEEQFGGGVGGLFGARYDGTTKKGGGMGPTGVEALTAALTDKDKLQTAQAGQEGSIFEATERLERVLGKSVVSAIADGFSGMAEAVRKSIGKLEEDRNASNKRTQRNNEKIEMVEKATKTMMDPNASFMEKFGAAASMNDNPYGF